MLIVRDVEFALECAIDFIDELERTLELQPRTDRLHAQVIFLVKHDAEGLLAIHDYRAAKAFGRVFATDEMAFNQDLFFQSGKILQ